MDLTEHLVAQLRAAKVKPTALAARIHVSIPFASQILSGKRGIRLTHVEGIASLLGVSIPALFNRDLPWQSDDVQTSHGDATSNRVSSAIANLSSSSPEVPHRGAADPISTETVIRELFAAAGEFKDYARQADEFAVKARAWAERLRKLSADAALDQLAGEQAPSDRHPAPASAETHRKVRGRHTRQVRRAR